MTVYVVESGEYEQRGVSFVAASREAAVRRVRSFYGDPKWSGVVEITEEQGGVSVEFKSRIEGLCCKGVEYYSITEYELIEGVPTGIAHAIDGRDEAGRRFRATPSGAMEYIDNPPPSN